MEDKVKFTSTSRQDLYQLYETLHTEELHIFLKKTTRALPDFY